MSSLTNLPFSAEIRKLIYDLYFENLQLILHSTSSAGRDQTTSSGTASSTHRIMYDETTQKFHHILPAILRVSRGVYTETRPYLYKPKMLILTGKHPPANLAELLPASYLPSLHEVTLDTQDPQPIAPRFITPMPNLQTLTITPRVFYDSSGYRGSRRGRIFDAALEFPITRSFEDEFRLLRMKLKILDMSGETAAGRLGQLVENPRAYKTLVPALLGDPAVLGRVCCCKECGCELKCK